MQQLHLEKLTWDTVDDVLNLRVKKEQKEYVAPNRDSVIDAYFAITEEGMDVLLFGVYLGEKAVGFIMISKNCPWAERYYDIPKEYYYVWRFMIDRRYQGNGYGKEALKLALDHIRSYPLGKAECCWLSYEPENVVAQKLYASLGFVEHPEKHKEDMEMPAILKL